MVINLNYNERFVVNYLNQNQPDKLLDFAGVTQYLDLPFEVNYARQIDEDHQIEKDSVENYIHTIGELGSRYLRNIKLRNFPVWWITSIAERNNRLHWGKLIFYFLEFWKKKPDLFKGNLTILLPYNFGYLDRFIQENKPLSFEGNISFVQPKKINTNSFIDQLKGLLRYIKFRSNLRGVNISELTHKNIFFTPNYSAVNNNDISFDIGWQKEKLTTEGQGASLNLPIPNLGQINEYVFNNAEQNYFLKTSPKIISLVFHFIRAQFKYLCCVKLKIRSVKANNVHFNGKLIGTEIFNCFSLLDNILIFLWLENFSKSVEQINIYYSDELYKSGRILSHFFTKNNHATIGVQHGLITKNHTVYRLTEKETSGDNSIPLPSKLLIWNTLFGDVLGLTSNRLLELIEYTNDAHYNKLIASVKELKKSRTSYNRKKVLWATTLWPHFTIELNIIMPIFEHPDFDVTIRLHPLKRYINRDMVVEALNGYKYQFSTNSYEQDLAENDFIIANSFSTVFYDALKLNQIVFRIENYGTICDLDLESESVISIDSMESLKKALGSIER